MMKIKKGLIVAVIATFCLAVTLFVTVPTKSQSGVYDPWVDLNDDGRIDGKDIARVSKLFGTRGTPFSGMAAIEYDSGWMDISDKAGQYFDVVHNLNSTGVIVDITGKTTADGGVHQKYFGGTDFVAGWNKTYGGTDVDWPYNLVRTIDGGYALAGVTYSYGAGDADACLVKTDAAGNAQWTKTYGGTSTEGALALVETGDGGYALAGITTSFGAGGYDFWLVKTDAAGNAMDGFKYGLAWVDSSANSITLYRGTDDAYWNYVRVRVWKVKDSP